MKSPTESFLLKSNSVTNSEAFEITEYGHQPSEAEFRRLIPFFP